MKRDGPIPFLLFFFSKGKGWARLFPLVFFSKGKRRAHPFPLVFFSNEKRRAPSLSIQNRKTNPFLLEKNVKKKIHQL